MTAKPTGPAEPEPDHRSRVLLAAVGAIVVLVIVGLIVALAGGDDDGGTDGDTAATVDPDEEAFGVVEVAGDPLPSFDANDADAAVGLPAPVVTATTPDGESISVGEGGEPTLVVFLAHWCPHCQAELPVLVEMDDEGAFDGIRTVAVLTGTNPAAPNFPPVLWLEREGWQGEIALDDQVATAAAAYGLTSYPYLVMLDEDGQVTGRLAGEQPPEAVEDLVDGGS